MVLMRYCEVCGQRVTESDLASGNGAEADGAIWCKAHKHLAPAPAKSPLGSTGSRRLKSLEPKDASRRKSPTQGSRRIKHEDSQPPPQPAWKNPILLIGGALALTFILAVILLWSFLKTPETHTGADIDKPIQIPEKGTAPVPKDKTGADSTPKGTTGGGVEHPANITSAKLVSYWKFDEIKGSSATDASGDNIIKFSTDPEWVPGLFGNAVKLNGKITGRMAQPGALPNASKPRSVAAWAKTTSIDEGSHWIVSYGAAANNQAFYIGMSGQYLVGGGYGSDVKFDNFWFGGVWHHVCLTYDGQTARLYADGVLLASAMKSSWKTQSQEGRLGGMVDKDTENWNGFIDDVRVYDEALSPEDVAALARAPGEPPAAPANLTAEPGQGTSITLKWRDNSNNESVFKIQRSFDETAFDTVALVRVNGSFYTDNLLFDADVWYRVVAWNPSGDSAPTNTVKTGTTPDVTPPSVNAICAFVDNPGEVKVVFNKPMEQTSAENSANYAIFPETAITSASLDADLHTVRLNAAGLKPGVEYTFSVHGTTDRTRARNAVSLEKTIPFKLLSGKNGLKGEYYTTVDLKGTPIVRMDPIINYDGTSPAMPDFPQTNISMRWTGFLAPTATGKYTLTLRSDDGVRMWVSGRQVINDWVNRGATDSSTIVQLTAGDKVPVKIEYFQGGGPWCISFYWEGPGIPRTIVPPENLLTPNEGDVSALEPEKPETPAAIPAASTFSEEWKMPFDKFGTDGASPISFEKRDGAECLKMTTPGIEFACIDYRMPADRENWSDWKILRVEAGTEKNVEFVIRIDDDQSKDHPTRFHKYVNLQTGWNVIDVPISDVAKTRNIAHIVRVVLTADNAPKNLALWFKYVKLMK